MARRPSPTASPVMPWVATTIRSAPRSAPYCDVVIHAEEVARVVLLLHPRELLVVAAIGRAHALVPLVGHHEVDVRAAGRVGVQRHPVVPGPVTQAAGVDRIRIDADDHLRE